MLVALFAEDIDLLPKYFVAQLLEDRNSTGTYDLLSGLFRDEHAQGAGGGRFKGVAYFSGGLFTAGARRVGDTELVLLRRCLQLVERPARNFRRALSRLARHRRTPRVRRALHQPHRHHEDRASHDC